MVSCNQVTDMVDSVSSIEKRYISYDDFEYIIDKNNRQGYLDNLGNPLTGHFVVMKDTLFAEEFQVKKGMLNGVHIYYNSQGKMTSLETYKNSVLHGDSYTYFPQNGQVKTETTYKAGKRVGDLLEYDLAGNLVSKTTLQEGVEYTHVLKDGKKTSSVFDKEYEGRKFNLLVIYDDFENISRVFGQNLSEKNPSKLVYVFDVNFKLEDSINILTEPVKARYFFEAMEGLKFN